MLEKDLLTDKDTGGAIMSYQDNKNRANSLRKQKEYAEALKSYEEIYRNHRTDCDQWDIWGYAYCLKMTRQHKRAAEVCEKALSSCNDFNQLKNVYAWSLFYLWDRDESVDAENHAETADKIINLCNEDWKYSPLSKTIFKVVKIGKENGNTEMMLRYLSLIPEGKLENRENSFTATSGKQVQLSSDLEIYYLYLTEALLKSGNYNECIEACTEGLKLLIEVHNKNNIWLSWRQALCYLETNQAELALSILHKISHTKKEWFVFKEIAECYYRSGDLEKAREFALKGANTGGDYSKKVNLYLLIGKIFSSEEKHELAKRHYQLAYKIREENGWQIDNELHKSIDFLPPSSASYEIHKELRSVWQELIDENRECHEGSVSNILPNNKAGFIKGNDGNSHYFSFSANGLKPGTLQVGSRVKYFLEDSFDHKKNQTSKAAVGIYVLQ
jgi:tetratricopeptide (TPR) repeat protein